MTLRPKLLSKIKAPLGIYPCNLKAEGYTSQNIYAKGWKQAVPSGRQFPIGHSVFVHPTDLEEIALMRQIKMWTGDLDGIKRLSEYCRRNSK